ncbi:hypothetical protein DFAR_1540034 [Desulfarculales bacterium]
MSRLPQPASCFSCSTCLILRMDNLSAGICTFRGGKAEYRQSGVIQRRLLPQVAHIPWNRWHTSHGMGAPHRVESLDRLKLNPQPYCSP